MKKETLLVALVAAVLMTACASMNPDLERARSAYGEAAADVELASNASVELYEAQKSLSAAEAAWEIRRDEEEVNHLSYVTERKVEIAGVAAERKQAEAEIEKLTEERTQYVLKTRTREADLARSRAEEAESRATELEAKLAHVGARPTDRGHVLTLGDVLFDFDKADLKSGAERNLSKLVDFLAEYPHRKVSIEGHTDSSGGEQYNLALSEQRARAVRQYLRSRGIAAGRISAEGFGEARPVTSNATPAGRQENRRVEIVIHEPDAG